MGILRLLVIAACAAALYAPAAGARLRLPAAPAFSDAWQALVVGTAVQPQVVGGDWPVRLTLAGDRPYVDVDFGHEVSGRLVAAFGDVSAGPPLVSFAFSETAGHLGFESDHWRGLPADAHVPSAGETWVDTPGCQVYGACSEGQRAFRFVRIFLQPWSGAAGFAVIRSLSVQLPPSVRDAPAYDGWFLSSDPLLNRAWYASVYTDELVTDAFDPAGPAVPGCERGADGAVVLYDGAKRDRCPAVGDVAVSGRTLLVSRADAAPLAATLRLFAGGQLADGYIPAGPSTAYADTRLFDYPAYWVDALADYVLYTGDVALAADSWPRVRLVLDGWYAGMRRPDGLLEDPFGAGDYAFVRRGGMLVAYYNAAYALALRSAARLAAWTGHADDAARWTARADGLAAPFDAAFWDGSVGAFRDGPDGAVAHPEDGNAFAILAGLATPQEASSALAYLARASWRPWGGAIVDTSAWDAPDGAWGDHGDERVYPFMSYFEVLARFRAGDDAGALEQLRRTWGWMLDPRNGGPGTTWEAIGTGGSPDGYMKGFSSLAHGWSTGAAPALTDEVLGVVPTSPGYASFDVAPHPGDLAWAQGRVPTPHGAVAVAWRRCPGDRCFSLRVEVPPATSAHVVVPALGRRASALWVDGRREASFSPDAPSLVLGPGSHTVATT